MKNKNLMTAAAFACALMISAYGCASKGAGMTQYENGLTSIFVHNDDSLTASVNVYIRAGSVDEKPSQAGLSHFLEHLMFKGSKNYTGDELSRRVENMGGYINAATSKEFTMYYINIQKDGVEEALKMLADVMQSPLFPQNEIDMERKVVIEEIQRHSDKPVSVLYESFFETVYKHSALKNSVLGTADVIGSVSRDEIYDYYSTHYVPAKMIVVISGNFDKNKTEKLVDETFGKFEKKAATQDPLLKEGAVAGADTVKDGNVEVSYMLGGFLGPDISSDDIYAADLALTVLGGGKSSRLYRVIKEEKQLAYSIGSSFMTTKGTGLAYVISVFDAKNLEEIKTEIKKQIESIINEGITEDELARAKLAIKTGWNFSHETPSDVAYDYGFWNLLGKPGAVKNYLPQIEALSGKDIQAFFAKYYSADKFTTMALKPKAK